MTKKTEPLITSHDVTIVAFCLMAALLHAPATGFAADACDGAGKQIDEISAQISEAIRPCADVNKNPCSKEQYQEIAARVKALTDRGIALTRQCFGVPSEGQASGLPPAPQEAQ